jgi:hypothetical protein
VKKEAHNVETLKLMVSNPNRITYCRNKRIQHISAFEAVQATRIFKHKQTDYINKLLPHKKIEKRLQLLADKCKPVILGQEIKTKNVTTDEMTKQ